MLLRINSTGVNTTSHGNFFKLRKSQNFVIIETVSITGKSSCNFQITRENTGPYIKPLFLILKMTIPFIYK